MRELLPEHADAIALAIFAVLGLVALASGLAVVTRRNPIAAIAWLVVHFVATACLYVVLDSQFLAAVQVLVYAGAIMVLFLFVIMLLAADQAPHAGKAAGWGRTAVAAAAGLVIATVLARVVFLPGTLGPSTPAPGAAEDTVEWLAARLLLDHPVAFELSSVPLLAAMAGVLVFTTRRVVEARRAAAPKGDAP